jgi:hypothetical protein
MFFAALCISTSKVAKNIKRYSYLGKVKDTL